MGQQIFFFFFCKGQDRRSFSFSSVCPVVSVGTSQLRLYNAIVGAGKRGGFLTKSGQELGVTWRPDCLPPGPVTEHN